MFWKYAANLQEKTNAEVQSNFIEITLRHEFSPVNLLHIFRTIFPKSTSGDCFCVLHFFYLLTDFSQTMQLIPLILHLQQEENETVINKIAIKYERLSVTSKLTAKLLKFGSSIKTSCIMKPKLLLLGIWHRRCHLQMSVNMHFLKVLENFLEKHHW